MNSIFSLFQSVRYMGCLAAMAALLGGATLPAQAQTYTFKDLYDFNGVTDGHAWGGVIRDANGNLYGTTAGVGGTGGTVYKISSNGVYTTLHHFNGSDGSVPWSGLTSDSAGNLYGTTQTGGSYGYGTVFKISTSGNFTSLYSFNANSGNQPIGGVAVDATGNLYGTTSYGGAYWGNVFKISPNGTYTDLFDFDTNSGVESNAGVTLDSAGNLYGTTRFDGSRGGGTVFKISSNGAFTKLHDFQGSIQDPGWAGVTLDASGNLYGTTINDGTVGVVNFLGAVYKISPDGAFTDLHDFSGFKGQTPGGVVLDAAGNLYGTIDYASSGYQDSGHNGVLYKLSTDGTYTDLYDFYGSTGAGPSFVSVPFYAGGNWYGTTVNNVTGAGSVYMLQVTPEPSVWAIAFAGSIVGVFVLRRRKRQLFA